jgi:hypothetical protein
LEGTFIKIEIMEVIGKVKLIGEVQTFGSNGFRKRELVVTTDEQYPQMIMVEFVQDKCDLLNNYGVGQDVKVAINLRGREWINPQGEAKYFNSIQGWRIEGISQSAQAQNLPPVDQFQPAANVSDAEPDDLPF